MNYEQRTNTKSTSRTERHSVAGSQVHHLHTRLRTGLFSECYQDSIFRLENEDVQVCIK